MVVATTCTATNAEHRTQRDLRHTRRSAVGWVHHHAAALTTAPVASVMGNKRGCGAPCIKRLMSHVRLPTQLNTLVEVIWTCYEKHLKTYPPMPL